MCEEVFFVALAHARTLIIAFLFCVSVKYKEKSELIDKLVFMSK